MLYVKLEDGKRELSIIFRHDTAVQINADGKEQRHPFKTTCAIFDGEEAIGTGVAKVDSRDHFKRTKGRKTALKSALTAAGIERPVRRQIWDEYFVKCNK